MKKSKLYILLIGICLLIITLTIPIKAAPPPGEFDEKKVTVNCWDGSKHTGIKVCFEGEEGCDPDPDPCPPK